jgi:hypothetical protein
VAVAEVGTVSSAFHGNSVRFTLNPQIIFLRVEAISLKKFLKLLPQVAQGLRRRVGAAHPSASGWTSGHAESVTV